MEWRVRPRRHRAGNRAEAQCRSERRDRTGRYYRAPEGAERGVPAKYAGRVSCLRGGGDRQMGTRGARGQHQARLSGGLRAFTLRRRHGQSVGALASLGGRGRNTTKCDSKKLTMKLTPIASALAPHIGRYCAAMTRVAVLAITPAMPEATKRA